MRLTTACMEACLLQTIFLGSVYSLCGFTVYAVVLYTRLCCIFDCAVYAVVLYMRLRCLCGFTVYAVVLYMRLYCIGCCAVHAILLYIYVFASAVQRSVVTVVPI